jgi:hypothetical protein
MAKSKKTLMVGTVSGLAILMLASSAWAQDAPVAKESPAGDKGGEGYGYEFSDDPLAAGGFGPNDATIKVRPKAARTTLIRPRTHFIPEMLKSVENI